MSCQACIRVPVIFLTSSRRRSSGAEAAVNAPFSLVATAVSSSQINLGWNDTNPTSTWYSIERSLTSSSGFVAIGTTGRQQTAYQDTGLSSGATYYYRRACVQAGRDQLGVLERRGRDDARRPDGALRSGRSHGVRRRVHADQSRVERVDRQRRLGLSGYRLYAAASS